MIKQINIAELIPNNGQIQGVPKNPRFIRDARFEKLKKSLQENGEMLKLRELLVYENEGKYVILCGNMRYRAAKEIGLLNLPCKIIPPETPTEKLKAITVLDNSSFGEWDMDALANDWNPEDLANWGVDFDFIENAAQSEADRKEEKEIRKLVDDFIIPPFSILNTRSKEWIERRNQWLDMGIKSELGRDDSLTFAKTSQPTIYYQTKNQLAEQLGRKPAHEEIIEELHNNGYKEQKTVSIFDPVLTEISYRWFNVKNGTILDPFAGGSVRGVVAAKLGMQYFGNDLREEQIEANRENAKTVLYDLDGRHTPVWTSGDSLQIDEILKKAKIVPPFDMIFSCPPYADLEVYSDDKRDISNMEYSRFLEAYREIIKKSCELLKENRFAVFVVGDVRDKSGVYRNFVGDTIQAFTDCGLKYYNHFILVNQINSLAIRIRRQFNASRKAGKTHQNVLAFFKGEPGEMPDTFEKINIKKAIEQFNASKEATEITEDVICFYKGDLREINKHFHSFDSSRQDSNDNLIKVKVSGKWIKHKFLCSADYIKNVCHGSCCTGSNKVLISLLPDEAETQQKKGYSVSDGGLLQADFRTKKCPHINKIGFCALHGTPDKPFGCIASPFTLNQANTLIIRNRYSLMKCHSEKGDYAYRVFRASLNLIFGKEESERICTYYDKNDGDIDAFITNETYQKLKYLDNLKVSDNTDTNRK
jgi:16S rRNA G966 N2-methylase RsmD